MKSVQTPKKDRQITNRISTSVSELTKKPHKIITKKCSDSALSAFPEDDMAIEDLQLSDNHQLDLFSESFLGLDPLLLPIPSRESTDLSDLTPSPASTVTKHVIGDNSSLHNSYVEENYPKKSDVEAAKPIDIAYTAAVETEMLVNHLRQAKTQVKNATGIDLLSKKLLDKLVDVVVEDCLGTCYENYQSEKILAMKFRALMLSFLPVFLGVLFSFVYAGEQSSNNGPPPT